MVREQAPAVECGAVVSMADGAKAHAHDMPGKLLMKVLSRLSAGKITIQTPAGNVFEYQAARPGPAAAIVMHNWRTVRRLISKGGVGFAEAYMEGDWTTPNLTELMALGAANADDLESTIAGSFWLRAINRLRHARAANTRRGSRRNIAAHYDLGNAFYSLWLDRGMSYSSACYPTPDCLLEDAQTAKQDRVIAQLGLSGGERVLEIGCGWGGLAERLLHRGAAKVTGLTLSTEQLAYSNDRLELAGLADRADMRLQDYRDVAGVFDRIVSIEMLEAVGRQYWPIYFSTVKERLAETGVAVIQVITIAKNRFEDYQSTVDFIQRYIFPGGMLPSDEILRHEIDRAGLMLRSIENFGQSYALTLAEWRRRFLDAWPEIQTLGFDLRFKRMWEYYLSYCEAGFKSGILDVGLYTLSRGQPA
jgi:cyclopropane-fatty-acyl-phospholipid synthase